MSDHCFICEKSLSGDDRTVLVRSKFGMNKLKRMSYFRNDGKLKQIRHLESIIVHIYCRQKYTANADPLNCHHIGLPKEGKNRQKEVIAEDAHFSFSEHCCVCGAEANFEKEKMKPVRKRRPITRATAVKLDSVLKMATDRDDALAMAIKRRFLGVNLEDLNARYHSFCVLNFRRNISPSLKKKRGRPVDEDISSSMNKMFSHIESQDKCRFTLYRLMQLLDDDDLHPDPRTVTKRMIDKYGDDLTIKTDPTIFCIRKKDENSQVEPWWV